MNNKFLKPTIGLSLGHFSIEIYASFLIPLYPIITSKFGIGLALFSLIIAIVTSCASVSQPFFGFISDKLKHRFFLISGLVLSSVFLPLSTKVNSIYLFAIFLFTGILASAFFHPQASTLMKTLNKNNPDISRMMGLFLGLGSIGYAIGPYIGTFLYEKLGFENLFLIGIWGILSAIFIYFYTPKVPYEKITNENNFFKILKDIFKNRVCVFFVSLSVIKSAFSVCFGTYIPFLLKNLGYNLNKIGIIVTLFFIAGGFATILSSKIEKKIGSRATIVLSMIAILPLCLCFLFLLNKIPYLAILCFVLSGFFGYLSIGIVLVLAQQKMPKYTGVISGIIQGAGWGIGGLALIPAGFIAQYYGINIVLIIISTMAFVLGISCLKTKSIQK